MLRQRVYQWQQQVVQTARGTQQGVWLSVGQPRQRGKVPLPLDRQLAAFPSAEGVWTEGGSRQGDHP